MEKYYPRASASKGNKNFRLFPVSWRKFRVTALGVWMTVFIAAVFCLSWFILPSEATRVWNSDLQQKQNLPRSVGGKRVYAQTETEAGRTLERVKPGKDHTTGRKGKSKKIWDRKGRPKKFATLDPVSSVSGFHEAGSPNYLTRQQDQETRVNETPADAKERQGQVTNVEAVTWKRQPSEKEVQQFQKLVVRTMECRNLPALSLSLVKRGRVVLATNLGYADPEARMPVMNETRFAIGSLTKAFTATVVTDFLMERNISLDIPVQKLLHSDFRLMDEHRTRSVTIRDLLGHRAGVPGYFNALLVGLPAHVTRSELLSKLQHLPAVAPLRSQFLYNNYLFTLAAHVVEVISGQSWETLMRDRILRPLGMTSTGFVDKVDNFRDFALPCALVNGSFRNLTPELLFSVSPCGPAGSLYSTAHDMAQWLRLLLADGKTSDGRQMLKDSVLKETFKAVMPPPGIGTDLTRPVYPISDVEQSYGMGWITSNYRGYRKIWHSGGIVTYSSRLWLLPGADAGLFVATSGPQTSQKAHGLTAITSLAADLLLGEEPWLNSSTVCSFPSPWNEHKATDVAMERHDVTTKKPSTKVAAQVGNDLDELTGTYFHEAFGEIVIERAGSEVEGDHKVTDKKSSNSSESATPTGNASTWLTLKFGRFGHLRISKVTEEANTWEGTFLGPLWYVTASDEAFAPLQVTFVHDRHGRVSKLRYPIDGQHDNIEFQKRVLHITGVSSHATSAAEVIFASSSLVMAVFVLLSTFTRR